MMRKLVFNSAVALVVLAIFAVAIKTLGGNFSPPVRLYLECAAVVIFFLALCWRSRAMLVPVYVGALLVPLCVFEAILQSKDVGGDGRIATRMRVEGAQAYAAPDSALGFRPSMQEGQVLVIKTTADDRLVFDVRYGFTKGYRVAHAASGKPVIWFLGCSLTFGEGLDDADSLPVRVGELAGADTYNFAFPGWGPHQALRLWDSGELEKLAPRPTLVVFGSFPGHAQRCAGKAHWDFEGPHYRPTATSPELQGPHRKVVGVASLHWLLTRLGIMDTRSAQLVSGALAQPTPADGEQCIALVAELARRSQAAGAQFVVLDWRSSKSNQAIADAMSAALKPVAPVLEVRSLLDPAAPKYQIIHDGHPNALALRKIAVAIAAQYGANLESAPVQAALPP